MRTTLLVVMAFVMGIAVSCAEPTAAPTPTATSTLTSASPSTTTPTSAISKIQQIKERGKLIVAVRQGQSPTGIFKDPAHSRTRDFELALARAIAKKLL